MGKFNLNDKKPQASGLPKLDVISPQALKRAQELKLMEVKKKSDAHLVQPKATDQQNSPHTKQEEPSQELKRKELQGQFLNIKPQLQAPPLESQHPQISQEEQQSTSQQPEQHKLPIGLPWTTLESVLAPETLDVVTNLFAFTHLTAVQSATIPAFLSHKDVCVQAITGSGKTLAFVIPIIEILTTLRTPLQPTHIGAMVITPTRELASQIAAIVGRFTSSVPLACDPTKFLTPPGLCIGGKNPEMELHNLKKTGANILIGTPGRLDQVLSTKFLFDPSKLEILVLDEADRLLEAGFQVNLTAIMKRLPKQRRTGLFSATLTTQIQELARMGLRNPVNITLKVRYKDEKTSNDTPLSQVNHEELIDDEGNDPQNYLQQHNGEENAKMQFQREHQAHLQTSQQQQQRHQAIPSTLTNYYQIIQPEHKLLHLVQFLMYRAHENIIIFFLTCAEVDYFYRVLSSFPPLAAQFNAFNNEMIDTVGLQHLASTQNNNTKALFCALHGQMNQSKRSRTLEAFKEHTTKHNAENSTAQNGTKRLGSVLLCTDVAARGVDVNHIDWVIQVDPPQQPDVFIHRIGRCARAGQRGQALTWLLPSESSFIEMMISKHVPFVNYTPVQKKRFDEMIEHSSATRATEYSLTDIEAQWDKVCWNPVNELYFQTPSLISGKNDDDVNVSILTDREKDSEGGLGEVLQHPPKKAKLAHPSVDKAEKIVALSNPTSPIGKQVQLPALPSVNEFKGIIPYNVYKVMVEKKENRKAFHQETKKQGQLEHIAFKKQQDVQKQQVDRQSQLPPFTAVSLQYPTIPTFHTKALANPIDLAIKVIPLFISHCRYVLTYDKYLFELCQKSYVSHINGYKEHLAKFIFPFDRLLFVHVAIGFGMLFLPQLADLKKYALIWPQLTRLQPKMITQFHNHQISTIKRAESEKKKLIGLKAIEKRHENEKEKKKEREFKEKQRQKKNKTRAKTTYEEVAKEWDELGDELREIKKKKKLSKSQQ